MKFYKLRVMLRQTKLHTFWCWGDIRHWRRNRRRNWTGHRRYWNWRAYKAAMKCSNVSRNFY